MSQQKENQFRDSIHKHMTKESPHQEKMHNPFRGGTFDDWYTGVKRDCWVEYKYEAKLKSVHARKLMRPLQWRWGTERHKEGRFVFVIVGFPQGGIIIHRAEWDTRIPIVHVEQRIQKRKELAHYLTRLTMGEKYVDL